MSAFLAFKSTKVHIVCQFTGKNTRKNNKNQASATKIVKAYFLYAKLPLHLILSSYRPRPLKSYKFVLQTQSAKINQAPSAYVLNFLNTFSYYVEFLCFCVIIKVLHFKSRIIRAPKGIISVKGIISLFQYL